MLKDQEKDIKPIAEDNNTSDNIDYEKEM